jgi:hypothetical protein
MSLIKGTGGSVSFRTFNDAFAPVDRVTLQVANWSVRQTATQADATTAGVVGSRAGTKGYTLDWTINLPVDSDSQPEEKGIRPTRQVTIWLKVGEQSTWHKISNTLVTFAGPVCDSTGDLLRISIMGTGGQLTEYSTSPPSLSEPPAPTPTPSSPGDLFP